MIPMLKKAGLSISLTEGQSQENQYEKFWFTSKEMYYVVTWKTQESEDQTGVGRSLTKVSLPGMT